MSQHLKTPPVPDLQIQNLLAMKRARSTFAVAQDLKFFDRFQGISFSIEEVANKLSITMRAAQAMVSVLVALEFVIIQESSLFILSQEAETYLVSQSPFYRPLIMSKDDSEFCLHKKAFTHQENTPVMPFAVHITDLPQETIESFIKHMHLITLPTATTLGKHSVFQAMENLLDVGGGSGSLSIGIATCNPQIECVVFDIPSVCKIADRYIEDYKLSHRITTQTGNMFDPLPQGFDGVLFGNIFHDWDLESCNILAQNAFNALNPDGHICLHEMVLHPNKEGPLVTACYMVSMLVHERGQQFTAYEFETLLNKVGFVDVQVIPSFGYYSLVSARKPKPVLSDQEIP